MAIVFIDLEASSLHKGSYHNGAADELSAGLVARARCQLSERGRT